MLRAVSWVLARKKPKESKPYAEWFCIQEVTIQVQLAPGGQRDQEGCISSL